VVSPNTIGDRPDLSGRLGSMTRGVGRFSKRLN